MNPMARGHAIWGSDAACCMGIPQSSHRDYQGVTLGMSSSLRGHGGEIGNRACLYLTRRVRLNRRLLGCICEMGIPGVPAPPISNAGSSR